MEAWLSCRPRAIESVELEEGSGMKNLSPERARDLPKDTQLITTKETWISSSVPFQPGCSKVSLMYGLMQGAKLFGTALPNWALIGH